VTDFIFGIRAEENGLRVAPSVSRTWRTFSMRRHFRGSEYWIEFSNPEGVETGVARIEVDGVRIEGTLIPAFPAGERHDVRVVMGNVS
jgi:cellobiose phosphorylase